MLPITRREMLARMGTGLGTLGLATVLSDAGLLAAEGSNPLAPKPSHFPGKAKAVIWLFMTGSPSQVDTFDYKPEVIKRHGEEIPPSVKGRGKISSMSNGQTVFPLMRPLAPFKQYGDCGRWVSDLMPHIGSIADHLAFIHTVWTPHINHDPADIFTCIPGSSWRAVRPRGRGSTTRSAPTTRTCRPTW